MEEVEDQEEQVQVCGFEVGGWLDEWGTVEEHKDLQGATMEAGGEMGRITVRASQEEELP